MRLTTDMRILVQKRLLEHRFDKEIKKLEHDKELFAIEVYKHFVDKYTDALAALPEYWFEPESEISVNMGGRRAYLTLPKAVPMPAAGFPAIKEGHTLCKRWELLNDLSTKLDRAHDEVQSEVRGVLYSVTTLEKLVKVWPEVIPFVQGIEGAPPATGTALAIPIKDINLHLGLPVQKLK